MRAVPAKKYRVPGGLPAGSIMTGMRILLGTVLCAMLAFTAGAAEVGKPSPPFTIQKIGSSTPINLSQYHGKVVAMAIMLTTCPHCQHLTQVLTAIDKEYAAKGVQIVGCAMNDDAPQLLPAFIQQFTPSFPVGYCNRDEVMKYLQYSVLTPFYVPHMVFLDRHGVVRGDYKGESDFMTNPEKNIRTQLDDLLKSSPTTSSKRGATRTASVAHHKQ